LVDATATASLTSVPVPGTVYRFTGPVLPDPFAGPVYRLPVPVTVFQFGSSLGSEYVALFVPSAGVIAVVAPLAIVYALALGHFAGWLRVRRGVRAPYTRKIFHFGIFTMASVVQLAWDVPGVVVFGATVTLVVLQAVARGPSSWLFTALARPTDEPHARLFIVVPLITTAIGGAVSNLFFLRYAYVGYLVAGWGDAVGEPVGTRWGKHRYRVPSLAGVTATRSLEGSAAVFVVGFAAATVVLLGLGFAAPVAFGVGLLCGLGGMVIEAFSSHGLDNLTVQVTASAVAWWLLGG
jgi:phytol kinase